MLNKKKKLPSVLVPEHIQLAQEAKYRDKVKNVHFDALKERAYEKQDKNKMYCTDRLNNLAKFYSEQEAKRQKKMTLISC